MELATVFYYGIWSVIAVQGVRHGLIRCYPLFYTYLVVTAVGFTVSLAAATAWGVAAPAYVPVYLVATLVIHAFEVAIILQLYYLARKPSWRADGHLVAALVVILVGEVALAPAVHYLWNTLHVVYFFEAYLAFRTVMRVFSDERILIGRNMGAILAALFVQAGILAINTAGSLSVPASWPYATLAAVIQAAQMLMWIIVLVGLWELDAPVVTPWAVRKSGAAPGEAVR